jgi:RNA polymerase sigma factor (sigma-70 family)
MKKAPRAKKTKARKEVESLQPTLRQAVRAACRKYLLQADEAMIEDFCEEIMLRLMENEYHRLQSFAEQSSRETWLYKVARNHVLNFVQRRKQADSLDEHRDNEFQVPASQEEEVWQYEQHELLEWALKELTARDRELYDLLFRQELEAEEVAARTGIKLDQVRKRKHKLVNKLKQLIEPFIEGEGGVEFLPFDESEEMQKNVLGEGDILR